MTEYVRQQLGNYRLIHHLGHGGFADVYLGEHIHLKTQAAIKVLHTELTSDEIEKFRTEARAIARLEHPHIVRVLDFGMEGYTPFLVMSYAPNGTLRQRHPRRARLPLRIIVSYVKQIAEALQYAHEQRLIHRDVKPENMLLGRNNEILLSDFGFALIVQSSLSQSTQEMAGTVPYMAPEQLQGKPRPASDQYSLGIVVYEWLTGERPFQGSVLEIATQHILSTPLSLRTKNPTIPSDVEEVVLTALAKDPQQRFAKVQAFAHALEQASQSVLSESSSSTIPLEISGLLAPDTQPLPVLRPTRFSDPFAQTASDGQGQPTASTFRERAGTTHSPYIPVSHTTSTISSSRSETSPISTIHAARRLPRRTFLTGLVGIAVGGAASSGIWLAKLNSTTLGQAQGTAPTSPSILPLPGTTLLTYLRHFATVNGVAWSPDGYHIASAGLDKTVRVWNAATGEDVLTYSGHKDWVLAVAWSPDGKYIASAGAYQAANPTSAGDKTVQVWEAATGKLLFTYYDHSDSIRALAWSPDGKRIASASYDKTVRVWDAFTGGNARTYSDHSAWVQSVAWAPDGKYIASAGLDKTVRVWDASTAKNVLPPLVHKDWVQSVAWAPGSDYIASASGDNGSNKYGEHVVSTWEAATGKIFSIYRGHADEVTSVQWSPDGKYIASGSGPKEHTVRVWEFFTGNTLLTYRGHNGTIWSVAWAPESTRIASASHDKTVQVWKAV